MSGAATPSATSRFDISADAVCLPQYAYMENRLQQSPCVVASLLIDECTRGTSFNVKQLNIARDEEHYDPPTAEQASICLCNRVVYNLVQACAACQISSPTRSTLWDYWSSNCISRSTIFPLPVPETTYVPRWALYDNSNSSAVAFLGSANLTEDPTIVTTTTLIIATPTSIPLYDGPPTTREQAATSKATAAVAGAIVAAVIGFLAIGFAFFFVHRARRRKQIREIQGQRLESSDTLFLDPKEKPTLTSDVFAPHPHRHDDEFSSRSNSRTAHSLTTNSVSTQSLSSPAYSYSDASTRTGTDDSYFANRSIPQSTISHSRSITSSEIISLNSEHGPFSDIYSTAEGGGLAHLSTRNNIGNNVRHSSSLLSGGSRLGTGETMSVVSGRSGVSSTGAVYGRCDSDDSSLR